MEHYIKVADDNGEIIEIPTDNIENISLATLRSQFKGATGLKYQGPNGFWRALRVENDDIIPPKCLKNWPDIIFYVVRAKENKRKIDENGYQEDTNKIVKRLIPKKCSDLIVLGLNPLTTPESLRKAFAPYGNLVLAEVKKDLKTGKSKGYGFIKFQQYEAQLKVLMKKIQIDGRMCAVKLPDSKGGASAIVESKIFIGGVDHSMSADDIQNFFERNFDTKVVDVFFVPTKNYAFVTFLDSDIVDSLYGESFDINGKTIFCRPAEPLDHQSNPNILTDTNSKSLVSGKKHTFAGNDYLSATPSLKKPKSQKFDETRVLKDKILKTVKNKHPMINTNEKSFSSSSKARDHSFSIGNHCNQQDIINMGKTNDSCGKCHNLIEEILDENSNDNLLPISLREPETLNTSCPPPAEKFKGDHLFGDDFAKLDLQNMQLIKNYMDSKMLMDHHFSNISLKSDTHGTCSSSLFSYPIDYLKHDLNLRLDLNDTLIDMYHKNLPVTTPQKALFPHVSPFGIKRTKQHVFQEDSTSTLKQHLDCELIQEKPASPDTTTVWEKDEIIKDSPCQSFMDNKSLKDKTLEEISPMINPTPKKLKIYRSRSETNCLKILARKTRSNSNITRFDTLPQKLKYFWSFIYVKKNKTKRSQSSFCENSNILSHYKSNISL